MKWINRANPFLYILAAMAFSSAAFPAAAPAQQPVYIYLIARVTDHVNLDMSEDRLRHILPMVERYRRLYPDAHVSATILFSGAVSQALQERNPRTHVLDFVKDYLHRNVIEVGYDGTDEPTYDKRPTLNILSEPSPSARWKIRRTVAEQFLREARDPLTGAPANGDGGLKEMQKVFGPAAYISGLQLAAVTLRPPQKVTPPAGAAGVPPPGATFAPTFGVFREWGGDTETLQMLRPYNTSAHMLGVPAVNPAQLPGYNGMIRQFAWIMSPAADTAPELYWQDSVLRISEIAPPVHMVKALEGAAALKGVLDSANRSTMHVVAVELGALDNYLQPAFAKKAPNAPMKYAYDHPQSPKLPAEALRPEAEVAAGWAKEDALLKWLAEDDFRSNPRDRFLSNGELSKMAGAPNEFSISTEALRTDTADALKQLGINTRLFNYARVDGHYLSLAELFQVMTDALAEYHRTGRLPQTVNVAKVYGPFRVVTGHGPNGGEVSAGELEALCDKLHGPLHDETPDANGIPRNSIPPLMKLNNMNLNPAQMIRLMGLALANPAPENKLSVRMSYMMGEAGAILPKTRPVDDVGFVWTLKPAQLAISN